MEKMMRDMLKAFVLSAAMMVSGAAYSQDKLTFHIPQPAGGSSAAMATVIADGLKKRGWDVSFKALGNCALAKQEWTAANEPFLTTWESPFQSVKNEACNMVVDEKNFVQLYASSYQAMCSVNDRGMDDYLTKGKTHNVGVIKNIPHDRLFADIEKDTGVKHNVIMYKTSSEMAAAVKTKEVDYVLSTNGMAAQQGAKCLWHTSSIDIANMKKAKELWPKNPIAEAMLVQWMMAKNLPEEKMKKLRKDVFDIMTEPELTSARSKRNEDPSVLTVTFTEAKRRIDQARELSKFD